MANDEYLCIGAIAGAFGVRGEVRVKSFTGVPEDVFAYSPWRDADGRAMFTVVSYRPVKDGFAAFVDEIATREDAMAAKSTAIYAPRSAMPELEDEEYYHADLIGLRLETLAGAPLGEVRAVQDFGAGDLLDVWNMPGVKQGFYIPFTRAAVPHLDLGRRVARVDPAEAALPETVLAALEATPTE